MANTIEVKVPDIGDYDDVPVIEVLVAVGDTVAKDQGLVTLESDKATMEVPSRAAGVVKELKVKLGDKLSEGSVVAMIEAEGAGDSCRSRRCPKRRSRLQARRGARARREGAPRIRSPRPQARRRERAAPAPQAGVRAAAARPTSNAASSCSAPGPAATPPRSAPPISAWTRCWSNATPRSAASASTSAAFRRRRCCTRPRVIDEAAHASDYGVDFGKPKIDLDKLRALQGQGRRPAHQGPGRHGEAAQGARRCRAPAKFVSPNEIEIAGDDGKTQLLRFEQCIIAAGSQAVKLPAFPWDDPRVMDSTDALRARRHPEETAGRRRRHHRPGNGDGVSRARQRSHRGRTHGPADAGRRSGSGQAARRSPEEAGRRRST